MKQGVGDQLEGELRVVEGPDVHSGTLADRLPHFESLDLGRHQRLVLFHGSAPSRMWSYRVGSSTLKQAVKVDRLSFRSKPSPVTKVTSSLPVRSQAGAGLTLVTRTVSKGIFSASRRQSEMASLSLQRGVQTTPGSRPR